ncbi:MAG: hypothetical protein A3G41_07235 [Elusimicrobia bacterium RIFCSPLOWO2_12_FULL_59_9]|nr:MAG: hypothetical protein A3G41_07235 [Elusimicrobia bacterium RIFCSPLOWO2_12_FULL_59_9]
MLLAKGVIRETKKTTLGGYQAKVPMPARRSVNVFLTTQAIDIIEAVLSDWNDKPTNEIVKYVKTRPPFIMASFDESIDFTKGDPIIALASKRNLNPEDMATELIRSSPDLLKISLQAIQEEKEHQFASQTEIEKLGLPV